MREDESNMILNEIPLSSDDIEQFNVHDYALFIQENLLPQWWFDKLRQRSMKNNNSLHNSTKLWAKVRAVTYMTTLAHRTGSWYSDDQTEISPTDEASSSASEIDEGDNLQKIEFYDVDTSYVQPEPMVPLRRSYSSIDSIKYKEKYSPGLPRSHSTTLLNSSDLLTEIVPSNLPILTPPLPPSPRPSPVQPSPSRVYRFLHCILL